MGKTLTPLSNNMEKKWYFVNKIVLTYCGKKYSSDRKFSKLLFTRTIHSNSERDQPFKTSTNFHDFCPLPSSVGSFLLLSVGKFGQFLTPPP